MQIKLFTIPVEDGGGALAEMNAFLRGNKILEVEGAWLSDHPGGLITLVPPAQAAWRAPTQEAVRSTER